MVVKYAAENSNRARTTVCQKLPADFQAKVDSFREFGEKQVTEHNMPPDHIINMDEVPLTFELNNLKLGQMHVYILTKANGHV